MTRINIYESDVDKLRILLFAVRLRRAVSARSCFHGDKIEIRRTDRGN